jgi:hypothetical protein
MSAIALTLGSLRSPGRQGILMLSASAVLLIDQELDDKRSV